MESTETGLILQPADLDVREKFPYYRWMRKEGIPIHFAAAGFSDITQLPREPWPRSGAARGAFLELTGTYQAERGMFVCEIPRGESLDVQHHLYEEAILILQGQGATEVWQEDGQKRTFEWGPGSLFAPPKNTYYRMFNLGSEPALFLGVTTAPMLFNGLFGAVMGATSNRLPDPDFEFVFTCRHDFLDVYAGAQDYFNRTENRVTTGPFDASIWYTNFIPDVNHELVENLEQKVAGGQLTGYRMAGGFPSGHISEWPVGRYHKAHCHGPGAVLIGLKGNGYVNLWPRELGIHPWQDGHADEVTLIEWGPNNIYVPPDGWFHQHMSTGKVPARHAAVYGGNTPLAAQRGPEATGNIHLSVRDGGVLIDYEDEDPEVRRYFTEANRSAGVECDMPPISYRTDSFPLVFR